MESVFRQQLQNQIKLKDYTQVTIIVVVSWKSNVMDCSSVDTHTSIFVGYVLDIVQIKIIIQLSHLEREKKPLLLGYSLKKTFICGILEI